MSNFNQDLDAESKVHQFLKTYGYSFFEQCNFDYTEYQYPNIDSSTESRIAKEKQDAGIDIELTRHNSIEENLDIPLIYAIDEKAAITACNTGLPTFCQELSFVLNGSQKKGWFLKNKDNTHYLYCYIALTEDGLKKYNKYFNVSQKWKNIDWPIDIKEIEIILVSKRKLRAYYNKEMVRLVKQLNMQNNKIFADIEYKGLGKKILRQNSIFLQNIHSSQRNEILEMYLKNFIPIDYVKNAKRLRYTDGRFNYVKTFSLAEQPINLIIRKTDLLRIAGYDSENPTKEYGHYFVTKEYGLKRTPTYWDFEKGDWIRQN